MSTQAQAPDRPDRQSAPPPTPPQPAGTATDTPPVADHPASKPALSGSPAGTGVLRAPGEAPRDVPLMSIQQDRETARIQVGPLTPETGVADVLLGSLGLVAVIVLASLIVGALVGGVLVVLKHRLGWRGPDRDTDDHISVTRAE